MANPEHLRILKQGVNAWNKWRQENPRGDPDLIKADLRGAILEGASLVRGDLCGANLHKTELKAADLRGANLDGADCREANLLWTNLTNACLNSTNLTGANLAGAILRRSRLADATLGEAIMYRTTLVDLDLSGAKGLATVRHSGPSSVGIDTIYRSKGNIPEVFLRGAGVPEDFIVYMRSVVAQRIDFYSCFISYSSKDQDFAEMLHAELQARGVRCWFAPKDLKIGDRFQERIEESIRVYDKVMVVLSVNSVDSRWVEREVQAAFERETPSRGGRCYFPFASTVR